jgi:hypothetical protein
MCKHFIQSVISLLLAALAFLPVVLAQTPPARDLSGIWTPRGRTDFFATPEMRPGAKERYDAVRFGVPADEQGLDFMDPAQACYATGPSRQLTLNRPFEIVHIPNRILILYEFQHERRIVYTDGRGHPAGWKPTWMGHSTGRWDGDTLVVETVGQREETWLDGLGTPHTEAMRYGERFRRLSPASLEVTFTIDDPESYAKPWGGTKRYELRPDWLIMEQINCEDYMRERVERVMRRP